MFGLWGVWSKGYSLWVSVSVTVRGICWCLCLEGLIGSYSGCHVHTKKIAMLWMHGECYGCRSILGKLLEAASLEIWLVEPVLMLLLWLGLCMWILFGGVIVLVLFWFCYLCRFCFAPSFIKKQTYKLSPTFQSFPNK